MNSSMEQSIVTARIDDASSAHVSSSQEGSSSTLTGIHSGSHQSHSGSSSSRNPFSFARVAEKESRRVFRSKICVLMALMIAAAVVGVTAFFALQKEANKQFESDFKAVSQHLFELIQVRSERTITVFGSLGRALTGYSQGTSMEWPFVTIPDFGAQLITVRDQIEADSISFCPLVTESRRLDWETYTTTASNQEWMETSLKLENAEDEILSPIRATVEPIGDDSDPATTVYAPIWQVSPVASHYESINFDSLDVVESIYGSLLEMPRPTFSNFFYDSPENGDSTQAEYMRNESHWPRAFLSGPVFEDALAAGEEPSSQALVGITHAYIPWHVFLKDQLPTTTAPGVELVLRHSCGEVQTISYRLDGPEVTFAGISYQPNPELVYLTQTTSLELFPGVDGCEITLHAYATADFQAHFQSNEPYFYLGAIIGIFVVAAIAFLIYDRAVEVRQQIVMAKVARSNAIVNSLFPTQVRDRLMAGEGKEDDFLNGTSLARKAMDRALKTGENQRDNLQLENSKPIADLYPHSTVMFADIANFTAWSSVREPTQVFTLLEAVYSSFDKIAKQRRVFKVETIGDCYVAVAGLPEPRKDHAVVMARFARDCIVSMYDVVAKLEIFLGPDTADLEIRVGLHSGPVTAGVLRGEKSRFQLFGDTVNTCARMESTGEKSKVHMSKDTADLLIKAGKSHWVKPRRDLVAAKGKGTMQTYWLEFKIQASSKDFSAPFQVGSHGDTEHDDEDDSLDDFVVEGLPKECQKIDRLVSWNVEILTRLLQKIVAMRKPRTDDIDKSDPSNVGMSRHAYNVRLEGSTPLDEVQEIIKLNNKTTKLKCNPSKVALGAVVESQLRDFVKTVASMYRQNPFHNFEHASHVTQSMTKFISRVVTPDEIDYQEMAYKKKGAAKQIHEFTYGITSDPLIEFACTMSALIHDLDHPGVPNAILVKEGTDIAEHYKNKSIAEQNSVDLAWELLMEPKYRELRNIICRTSSEMDRFRQLIVNSIMATDIADKELGMLRKKRWEKAFSGEASSLLESQVDSVNRKATIVIEHLIQAADVAHTMQHWHVYIKWNERLFRESYEAYLAGRSDVDPSEGWYKGEIGFFDFYVIPLAKKLDDCGVFGVSSDECLEYAKANKAEWVEKGEEILKGYLAKYPHDIHKRKVVDFNGSLS